MSTKVFPHMSGEVAGAIAQPPPPPVPSPEGGLADAFVLFLALSGAYQLGGWVNHLILMLTGALK